MGPNVYTISGTSLRKEYKILDIKSQRAQASEGPFSLSFISSMDNVSLGEAYRQRKVKTKWCTKWHVASVQRTKKI